MTRHDTTIAGPRRGRACDACHANKTKCDGGPQCSLCLKRNIECTYKLVDASIRGSLTPTVAGNESDEIHVATGEENGDFPMINESETDQGVSPDNINVQGRPQLRPDEFAIKILTRLTKDAANSSVPLEADYEITPTEEEWLTSNTKKYFTRFHETWPIVHSVTFYCEPRSFASLATVTMIALWLEDPEQLTEAAIRLHKTLMTRFLEELVRFPP